MNLATVRFVVVEDLDEQREEVLNALLKAGLEYDNCLGEPSSYSAARDTIEQQAGEVDLVFLDLNLPGDHESSDLDKDFGYQLLHWIHIELNARPNVHIRVIIVSGEYSDYGVRDKSFRESYQGTLVGIAPKNDLPDALSRALSALNRDHLLEQIQALRIPVVNEYLMVMNSGHPALSRLEAAKEIACRLVIQEGEFRAQNLGCYSYYSDRLSEAIKELIEQRFDADPKLKRPHPSVKFVPAGKSWGNFVWRGLMYQHLYAINNYYNYFKHVSQQPYTSPPGTTDEWIVPQPLLDRFNRGEDAVQIVQLLVREVLYWYLPWYEQTYLPWFKTVATIGDQRL